MLISRLTDRQTDGRKKIQSDRETGDKQIDREAGREAEQTDRRQASSQAGRQTDRQTGGRQVIRQAGRQKDIETINKHYNVTSSEACTNSMYIAAAFDS